MLDTARDCGKCHVLNVAKDGQCNTKQDLPADTRLVCLMQVNNEIGTIQPTVEWHRKAKENNALYFCDAVQAYGKIEVTGADMIAISAHKFHGPKGVGALWVREGLDLEEVQTGGGQEFGVRSGTLSPALIAGMGVAAAEAKDRMAQDLEHVQALWHRATDIFADWEINGSEEARYHGNLNIRPRGPNGGGLDVNRLMSECRNVMFSAGSACASGSGPNQPCSRGDRLAGKARQDIDPAGLRTLHHGGRDRESGRDDQRRGQSAGRIVKIRFTTSDGEHVEAEGEPGDTLLRVAQAAGMPLEGTCEGQMACSTCHVLVDADWFAQARPGQRGRGRHARSGRRREAHQPPVLPDRAG